MKYDIHYHIHQRDHEQRLQRAALRRMVVGRTTNDQPQHSFLRRIGHLFSVFFL